MKTRISTAVVRRAAGKLLAGEAGGDDAAAFTCGTTKPKPSSEWPIWLAREAEADDGAAGVLDGGKLGGEGRVALGEQRAAAWAGTARMRASKGSADVRSAECRCSDSRSSCQRCSSVLQIDA